MKKKAIWLTIAILLMWNIPVPAQYPQYSATFPLADSIKIQHPAKKNYWRPTIAIIGLNAGIWAFDRYTIAGGAEYNISINTIRRNLQHGFVWDNDQFSTNLLWHPYHGGLYFNIARSDGLNFWQSIPYAFVGSLMWEYFMENEYPSINDFIATPIGGMALGEITFRLSNLLTDNRATGWERFGREFLSTLISPMRGLNRIISGDAWKTGSTECEFSVDTPVNFCVSAGYRGLAEDSEIKNKIDNTLFLDLQLLYGNLFSEENEKPYDAFLVGGAFNFFSKQPVISNVNVVGQLWGKNIPLKSEKSTLHWGVFQHFDYYDSNTVVERQQVNSYRIAEAAALGIGDQYRRTSKRGAQFFLSAYLNGILLGGSITDYYRVTNRDYNLGSGFSSKINAGLLLTRRKTGLNLKVEDYRLFTWKGYDPKTDLTQLSVEEQQRLNAQGDKGNVRFTIYNMSLHYRFNKYCMLSLETSCYLRYSHYKYFPDIKYRIVESKIGIA
ncbi:MAG: DUF3943 domain-containing protein, partial [Prevotellaceae bacterium]|nr:DUF3943 domain-containing protein [Prevotellaceae bacterium]